MCATTSRVAWSTSSPTSRATAGGATRSCLPTNVQLISGFFGLPIRPNYVPGQPTTFAANWPFGNYNPNAFVVPPGYNGDWGAPENIGTVGRNALRGPAFFQWDLSAM